MTVLAPQTRHGFFMPERNDDAVVVIPARYESTRLPAKALADIDGRPMIERVYRQACKALLPESVIVATDSTMIRDALAGVADVRMTSEAHTSGSDRVAEVARGLPHGIVVNVQGDLPLLDPTLVDVLIERLRDEPDLEMTTAAVAIASREELENPSAVKVVCNAAGRALYFSRSAIPHDRDRVGSHSGALHHIGIYAYRRKTLLRFADLPVGELERTEKLEQLRALENGILIGVVSSAGAAPMEVDTAEDLEAVRSALAKMEPGEK